ncbi:MAG: proton-conducting transporter membrane subunit, partial [Burkholderiales bacterium]
MSGDFPVALILIIGSLFVPLLGRRARAVLTLLLPVATFAVLLALPEGVHAQVEFLGTQLVLMRIDRLSLLFSYVFLLATFLASIYALHEDDRAQQAATMLYAGSALGAVFAGDLLTLFVFLEIAAVSSAILIWARRTRESFAAGMRYLVIQLAAGMLLLAGIAAWAAAGNGLDFGHIGLEGPGGWLILLALGIKCA